VGSESRGAATARGAKPAGERRLDSEFAAA
jgi:hypothetical protein